MATNQPRKRSSSKQLASKFSHFKRSKKKGDSSSDDESDAAEATSATTSPISVIPTDSPRGMNPEFISQFKCINAILLALQKNDKAIQGDLETVNNTQLTNSRLILTATGNLDKKSNTLRSELAIVIAALERIEKQLTANAVNLVPIDIDSPEPKCCSCTIL